MAAKDTVSTQTSQQTRSAANIKGGNAAISLPAVPAMEQKQEEPVQEKDTFQLQSMPDGADTPAGPNPPPVTQKKGGENIAATVPFKPSTPRQAQVNETVTGDAFQLKTEPLASVEAATVDAFKPIQKKENNTGLPDNLKSGVENISGYDMSDVKVHYNSSEPKQLQAHAYAQGTDIHVAPGQEKHLPHEAWHVVQQKQGRVKPTIQMKGSVPVNDDAGLEKEADEMGAKAIQGKFDPIQRKEDLQSGSADGPAQLAKAKIIGVTIGKTRIYNGNGTAVGHIAKNAEIDVDENDFMVKSSRTLVRITSGDSSILWNNPDALLNDAGDLWISKTRYTIAEDTEEEADTGPDIKIPLFGQELTLSMDEVSLAGSIEKEFELDLPNVSLGFQFPLPTPVPAFVSVGLEVGLNFGLSISGGYTITVNEEGHTFAVEATAGGKAGMDVAVKVGAGVGVANIVGVEAGLFAGAAAEFDVTGTFNGEVNRQAGKDWVGSSFKLDLESNASLVGKAGTYIEAKLLQFGKEKKFTLLEKEFAKWQYKRTKEIQKAGVTISDIMPKLADFDVNLSGDYAVPEDERVTAPLLGKGRRGGQSSDDYEE